MQTTALGNATYILHYITHDQHDTDSSASFKHVGFRDYEDCVRYVAKRIYTYQSWCVEKCVDIDYSAFLSDVMFVRRTGKIRKEMEA